MKKYLAIIASLLLLASSAFAGPIGNSVAIFDSGTSVLGIATSITPPGLDTNIPTEKATFDFFMFYLQSLLSRFSSLQNGAEFSKTIVPGYNVCNFATDGATCILTAPGNTSPWTLNLIAPAAGNIVRIYVIQAQGGPVPLPTFSPAVRWIGATPTFSGTANKRDAITCQYSAIMSGYDCALIGNNF